MNFHRYALLILAVFFTAPAFSAVITYTATDLADTADGDVWEYSYTVTNHDFVADTGFTIYFDLGLYDLLDPFPPAPNSDWDVLTWDPDPSIPDDGAYDALAWVDNASLADDFTVSFIWLGDSAGPGSQYFEIYDYWTLDVLDDGVTAAVPEPSTWLLMMSGLFGMMFFRSRKSKTA